MTISNRNEYLDGRLAQYDQWLKQGKIPTSTKVIPVGQSLSTLQWVLPTEQALKFLRNARSFALTECSCRKREKRCDNPLEVCFLLNDVADKFIATGKGRAVTLDEAKDKLRLANERGLVHLTIYNPEQHVYAVCSCCECCCHDMRFMKAYKRPDLVAHSDYIAVTDLYACVHCGDCVDRCVFDARSLRDGELAYDPNRCYGCGLCVTVCPVEATRMVLRKGSAP